MFQFTDKLKVAERVKVTANGIPATIPNAMDGEGSRADAPPVSLCITFSVQGSRLTQPIATF
jgi:hypothetical protein